MANYIVWKNKVISMVRGDSFKFNLVINEGNDEASDNIYTLKDQDALYFALMEPNKPFEDAILIKEYTADTVDISPEDNKTIIISLVPEDTELLQPGTYYYTVKLNKLNELEGIDETITVIPKTKFFIID